ncbi:dethiobiotin synthase [Pasteurella bettyae]|uniref:ATP-dependent dethiobiotin synthetase BioD n=1 Tax=Pasteurella bettyae CCUG 2042 TaxID=1095749 RepID=I3DH78_9PAST|nr:dethiobiotin synthase [Pasteurella bettyae]EIJ71071.1 dethiobiotin synthase [Pasteurella bettyae CCUG 2042]SUB22268.1 dethiobiotin synthase-2 [Pasteurella bettyae]
MTAQIYFVSGIDTDIGKTVVTGWLAKRFAQQGKKVITQKMIQTGCVDYSTDIQTHRQIQGIEMTSFDKDGTTCPYLFAYPCSPHLAAQLEQKPIDPNFIQKSTALLAEHYDIVLLEGAGGLAVPYNDTEITLDYLTQQRYPVILVTSGRLGSINHTILSLLACRQLKIEVAMVVFNNYPNLDELITDNTKDYLQRYLQTHFPVTEWLEVGEIEVC